MDEVIQVSRLSKDYGEGRGVFGLDLDIKRGEVYGYVGTNGSGKTTTIRSMMGFIRPDAGVVEIMGMDAWEDAAEIKRYVGYVPGEIAFPSVGTGETFLKLQAEYLGVTDFSYMNRLLHVLRLDASADLKKMSKGMKQKTVLVAALIGNKDILLLDEPTTGLDPLMREVFLELIYREKQKGRTIFMSSHIFEEIEEVCDKVSMIKDGSLLGTLDLHEYRCSPQRTFDIIFDDASELTLFLKENSGYELIGQERTKCTITFPEVRLYEFLDRASRYKIKGLHEDRLTLQEEFMKMYRRGK